MIKIKKLKIIIFLFAIFYTSIMYGQSHITVTGYVLDGKNRESLIGVTVQEKGTLNGTITDNEGKFSLRVPPNATLIFSYMGFEEKEIKIDNNNREMLVLMDEKTEFIDEIIVIGYGVQRKSDITGSISSVSGKDINDVPVASALQALQGKASGVNIIQNTGAPGSSVTIKIRGTGTINDSDPLYVVDGFIVDDISHINPNDIESIEIFKDAASSAIYGARGANGIVVITTKGGQRGDTRITVDGYVGFSNPWKTIPVMNTEQFALMDDYMRGNSFFSEDGVLYHTRNEDSILVYDNYKFTRVDSIRRNSPANWWDAITQLGIRQQYNISMSGGSDKSKYMVSASYFDEKGIVKTSNYKRFNTRLNLNNQITRWLSITANISYSNENRNQVPEGQNGVLKRALYQNPMVITYNLRGYWEEGHPLAIIARNHDKLERHRVDMNLSLNAQIFKLLNYQFKVSNYIIPQMRSRFSEVNKLEEDFAINDLTTVRENDSFTNKWEVNNLLTFSKKNKTHDLTLLAGQIVEGNKFRFHNSERRGTASNYSYLQYLASAYTGDKNDGLVREWTAIGFVGRINYNLLDRYLFQANIRADASSVFAKSERWGFFPSVSLGWKFTSEQFMQDIEWLSFGKLRVGWGQLGNNRIGEYARYTLLSNQFNYPYGVGDHILQPGITGRAIGNEKVRWEKTKTTNIALELGFLKNRLNFEIDLFDKLTTDMLLRVPVMISTGLSDAPITNAGSVRNRGIDLSVNHKNKINKFNYEIGFNVSYIKNTVESLGSGNEPVWGAWVNESIIFDFTTKTDVGRPIGNFYGYVTDGIFNTYSEIMASAQYDVGKRPWEQTTLPGDFRFVDINGDGVISPDDRTYIGSPLPDFIFGIPLSFSYSNRINLTIFFQGQTGNKIFNVMDYYLNNGNSGNVYANLRDKHWSNGPETLEEGMENFNQNRRFFPANHNASVPDLRSSDRNRNFRASDFMLQDGSYMRLKEARLTYNFSKKFCSKLQMQNFSIYLGGYNLLTFTKYNGFDPEVGRMIGEESNNINMGIDHGNYPQSRTITVGLKIIL